MVKLEDTDPRLIKILRDAGKEWGAMGVASTAAQLTDVNVLIRLLQKEMHYDLRPECGDCGAPFFMQEEKLNLEDIVDLRNKLASSMELPCVGGN